MSGKVIEIAWEDTESKYLVFMDHVCWAFLDRRVNELHVWMANGKEVVFDGQAATGLYAELSAYAYDPVNGGRIGV